MKAIIFDLDDTLLWDEKSIRIALSKTTQYASNEKGISQREFLKQIKLIAPQIYATYETFEFTKDIGINPFEGLWGTFDDNVEGFAALGKVAPNYQFRVWHEGLKIFGIEDDLFAEELRQYFIKTRLAHPYLYDETLEVLQNLKPHYKLALLTNGAPSLQNTKLNLTPELKPYFDEIVISGFYGHGKPNEGIFKHLLNLLNVDAKEAWMVGDNLLTDILGANHVGMTSVWINHDRIKPNKVIPTFEIHSLRELLNLI